jgi:protein-S-isoprenylcysteine O-methyltransferase Ste14
MAWASFPAPDWVRWSGVILGFLTVPAVYWVFASLDRNVSETVLTKQEHHLVTKGPYARVRHPLYTTGLTLLLSIGLMTTSWLILAFTAGAFLLIRFLIVPLEEKQLLLKFGDDYRAMMSRTGRFLPGM